ncbi:MAG: hypothetical protein A3G71_07200 [Gammaproteobacteria bacterium RIFCSPLOWO2_12_FULL_38_14]|nr:MAG: hypothetical protein A3B69_03185 [Gammaproteobacteria bacterium RIFCSPHIGHO2_02_FULL_38_33]OGT77736.1 MAG: hypothetical protein A3G71_07200 [Gammaproteobacteria bacterium RIFCSPLOWO2_12_FULL_38_14]
METEKEDEGKKKDEQVSTLSQVKKSPPPLPKKPEGADFERVRRQQLQQAQEKVKREAEAAQKQLAHALEEKKRLQAERQKMQADEAREKIIQERQEGIQRKRAEQQQAEETERQRKISEEQAVSKGLIELRRERLQNLAKVAHRFEEHDRDDRVEKSVADLMQLSQKLQEEIRYKRELEKFIEGTQEERALLKKELERGAKFQEVRTRVPAEMDALLQQEKESDEKLKNSSDRRMEILKNIDRVSQEIKKENNEEPKRTLRQQEELEKYRKAIMVEQAVFKQEPVSSKTQAFFPQYLDKRKLQEELEKIRTETLSLQLKLNPSEGEKDEKIGFAMQRAAIKLDPESYSYDIKSLDRLLPDEKKKAIDEMKPLTGKEEEIIRQRLEELYKNEAALGKKLRALESSVNDTISLPNQLAGLRLEPAKLKQALEDNRKEASLYQQKLEKEKASDTVKKSWREELSKIRGRGEVLEKRLSGVQPELDKILSGSEEEAKILHEPTASSSPQEESTASSSSSSPEEPVADSPSSPEEPAAPSSSQDKGNPSKPSTR